MLQDMQAFFSADSVQTDRFCLLTKKTQEFFNVQLTDVYGSCVVELRRSCMQEATLLTTEYLICAQRLLIFFSSIDFSSSV